MGFEIKNHVLIRYIEEPGVTKLIVPDGITEIGEEAFMECDDLEEVILPDGLEIINPHAFFLSGLKKINIPESVKLIDYYAFGGYCTVKMNFHKNQRVTKIKQFYIWDNNAPEKRLMAFFENPSAETFSVLKADYKFPVACSYYDIDEKICNYLKRNIKKAVCFAIEENQPEILKDILERELIIKKHIDELIQYAIAHTQKGGNPEFQIMLTDYKYQHFPADIKQISRRLKL